MAYNLVPYTNFHDLNLDWILRKVKEMDDKTADIDASVTAAENSATAAANSATEATTQAGYARTSVMEAEDAAANAAYQANRATEAADSIGTAAAGVVSDWMEEHVTPSTTYVIDDTLSIRGAAADAYATGQAVAGAANVAPELVGIMPARFVNLPQSDSDYTAGAIRNPTVGQAISFGTQTSYKHIMFNVVPGLDYFVQTTFNSQGVTYFCFTDNNDIVVSFGPSYAGTGISNEITFLTAPEGATRLYVTTTGALSSQNRIYAWRRLSASVASELETINEAEYVHPVPVEWVQGIMSTETGGVNTTNGNYAHTGILTLFGPARIAYAEGSDLMYETLMFAGNEYNNGGAASSSNFVRCVSDYGNSMIISADSYPAYIMLGLRKGYTITAEELAMYNSDIAVLSTAPAAEIADISMFERWAITGCSWDAGSVYKSDDSASHVTHTGLGWAENLARQTGTEAVNFAVGGTNLLTWWNFTDNADWGMRGLLAADAVPLYWLVEGNSNDANYFDTEERIGSLDDLTGSYTSYPSTFYGIMGRIIETIMAHAPDSKIIVTSPDTTRAVPGNVSRWTLETAVKEIAEHYDLPFVDIKQDPFYPDYVNTANLVRNHPTAMLYSGAAKMYGRMFAKACREYYDYFKDYTGVIRTVPVTWSPIS